MPVGITSNLMNQIRGEAERVWGEHYQPDMNAFKEKLFGSGPWKELTADHGARILSHLRELKAVPVAAGVDADFDDADPFSDID